MIQTVPAFFMQWVRPELVLSAVEQVQSARFEFGESAASVVRLRLAASQASAAPF